MVKILKKGPGIPLVFLHGFLGSSADWLPMCSYLHACHCLGMNLPGHGDSPFTTTFEFQPPAKKFHLIGYSMGGRLALQYALRYPEKIGLLLIASAHPGLNTIEAKQQRLKSDAAWAALLLQQPIDEFLKRWYDQPLFVNFRPDLSLRRKQNRQALASALLHYSLGHQPILQVPKAVHVVGEKDEKFRILHPNAIIVPNASHMVHLENPLAFAQILQHQLRQIL